MRVSRSQSSRVRPRDTRACESTLPSSGMHTQIQYAAGGCGAAGSLQNPVVPVNLNLIRTSTRPRSVQAKLLEPVVVDAEEVRQLVEDRRADLCYELVLAFEVLLERFLVDVDHVRRDDVVAAVALGQRDAAVEAVHRLAR